MLQKGTLYSPSNNENSVEFKKPLPNVYIYFSQNGTRKYTVKTDAKGAFSVDLALGNYQVTISQGAGFEIFPLGGGAPFELTKDSTVDAFEKWVLAPVYLKPEENPLVILLNTIATEARESAQEAKKSAEDAEKAVSDTVGSGKLMREGAWGLGGVQVIYDYDFSYFDTKGDIPNGASFLYASEVLNAPSSRDGMLLTFRHHDWGMQFKLGNGNTIFFSALDKVENGRRTWCNIFHTENTTIDSNGFLKAASPIIRLFNDRIETNSQFKEEPVFEKIGVGTYKISNTLGLAKEGWTYEKPRGKDGNPYFHIKVDKLEDGCIISVHDVFEALEEATIVDIDGSERKINKVVKILGEARDIKDHERWIDLRFHEEPEEIEEIEEIEEEPSDLDKFLEEHNAVLL